MAPPRHPSTLVTLATLALLLVTGVAAVDTGGINDGGGSAYGEGGLLHFTFLVCVSSEVILEVFISTRYSPKCNSRYIWKIE